MNLILFSTSLLRMSINRFVVAIAARSHCPDQRRAMRKGRLNVERRAWNFRPSSSMGPGGRRLTVMFRSSEPLHLAPVIPGQSQRTCACDQNRLQLGHALTWGRENWRRPPYFHCASVDPTGSEELGSVSGAVGTGAHWQPPLLVCGSPSRLVGRPGAPAARHGLVSRPEPGGDSV